MIKNIVLSRMALLYLPTSHISSVKFGLILQTRCVKQDLHRKVLKNEINIFHIEIPISFNTYISNEITYYGIIVGGWKLCIIKSL